VGENTTNQLFVLSLLTLGAVKNGHVEVVHFWGPGNE
jgi:hypothetical protein